MEELAQYPHFPTGSTTIYGKGKDVDYVVLVGDVRCFAYENKTFTLDTCDIYADNDFHSFRRGDVNLIVTELPWLYDAFRKYTDVMMLLADVIPNEDKAWRVSLCESIRKAMRP